MGGDALMSTKGYVGKHNGMEFVGQNGRYSYWNVVDWTRNYDKRYLHSLKFIWGKVSSHPSEDFHPTQNHVQNSDLD